MSRPPRNSEHVLIDGDIICYSVGFASERKDSETGELSAEPVEYALSSVKRMIQGILKNTECKEYTVVLTGDCNFREEVATIKPYKGNRADARKPIHYEAIREYLKDVHAAVVVDGEEADDYLGYTAIKNGWTIATIDKDLDNIPGWHYNWNKEKLYYVSVVQADRNFAVQCLVGDATDNIPGLFKMTGQRATPTLKERVTKPRHLRQMMNEVWDIWMEAFLANDMCNDEAEEIVYAWLTEIATLLWISRKERQRWTDLKLF